VGDARGRGRSEHPGFQEPPSDGGHPQPDEGQGYQGAHRVGRIRPRLRRPPPHDAERELGHDGREEHEEEVSDDGAAQSPSAGDEHDESQDHLEMEEAGEGGSRDPHPPVIMSPCQPPVEGIGQGDDPGQEDEVTESRVGVEETGDHVGCLWVEVRRGARRRRAPDVRRTTPKIEGWKAGGKAAALTWNEFRARGVDGAHDPS
jgi:hypothetical protein